MILTPLQQPLFLNCLILDLFCTLSKLLFLNLFMRQEIQFSGSKSLGGLGWIEIWDGHPCARSLDGNQIVMEQNHIEGPILEARLSLSGS